MWWSPLTILVSGRPGCIPYLIGESEGRAVLDSVRAARDLPDAGASNRFAVWGHSQGGHASLYTGELAASYAPDLKLVGVAAAAPVTYLIELFDADKSSSAGRVVMLNGVTHTFTAKDSVSQALT